MKSHVDTNRIILSGKVWEIRAHLQIAAKKHEMVANWIKSTHLKK